MPRKPKKTEHDPGAKYIDPVATRNFNANCEALNKAVKAKRRRAKMGWWSEIATEIEKRTGLRISIETIRGWLNGKGTKGIPDHTMMPTIIAIYNVALELMPPLILEDLYRPNVMKHIDGQSNTIFEMDEMRISIEDYDHFGAMERQYFENVFVPLLKGETPSREGEGAVSGSSQQFQDFLEKHYFGIEFLRPNFSDPPGQTCRSTAAIETKLARALAHLGIEPRVAPVIDKIQKPFGSLTEDDLQRFRITLLGRFGYQYVMHCLHARREARLPTYLALAGGVHVGRVVRHMTGDDVVMMDGVAPLALTRTEQIAIGFALFDLRPDVLDPPGLRANEFVQVLGNLAERIGHKRFTRWLATWYRPTDVSRDRLFPRSLRLKYFEKARSASTKEHQGNPALLKVAIAKLDALERYFDFVDNASISLMSLGHLSTVDEPFKAVVRKNVAGNVLFRFLSTDGRPADEQKSLNDQVLGPPLEWLKTRCASGELNAIVMATGAVKLPILLAAVRGGYCKTLLLDAHLAELLYEALSAEKRNGKAARPSREKRKPLGKRKPRKKGKLGGKRKPRKP